MAGLLFALPIKMVIPENKHDPFEVAQGVMYGILSPAIAPAVWFVGAALVPVALVCSGIALATGKDTLSLMRFGVSPEERAARRAKIAQQYY